MATLTPVRQSVRKVTSQSHRSDENVSRNRLRAVLLHIPWYALEGPARLAADVRVSRSTITRVIGQKNNPSPALASAIVRAVSRRHGKTVPLREIFLAGGDAYPTASVCELMGTCSGCLPPEAYDERSDRLRPAWKGAKPGVWCRYPLSIG